MAEKIASYNYGKVKSDVYWLDSEKSTYEIIKVGSLFLVRGSKKYQVIDKYGSTENFRSKMGNVNSLMEYLKSSVRTFNFYLYYCDSITPKMLPEVGETTTENLLLKLNRELKFKQDERKRLLAKKQLRTLHGRDETRAKELEQDINELKKELKELKSKSKQEEDEGLKLLDKGYGLIGIISVQSPVFLVKEKDTDQAISYVLKNLKDQNNIIKQQAWSAYSIVIKELENPAMGLHVEELGIVDPRVLDQILEKHDIPELKDLQGKINDLFLIRATEDLRIGEKTTKGSVAAAKVISDLLKKSLESTEEETNGNVPQPDKKLIPSLKDLEKKKDGFIGWIMGSSFELTELPAVIDYDLQGPRHILLAGGSGSGKTVCAQTVIEGALIKKIPCIILDPTDQWTGLLKPCESKSLLSEYKKFGLPKSVAFKGKVFTPGRDVGINLQGNMLERPIVSNDEELFNTARDTAAIIGSFVDLNKKEQILVENAILDNWKKDQKLTYKNIAKATEDWCNENNKKIPSELDLKLRRLKGQTILFSEKGITDITEIWKPGEVSVISLKKLSDKQKVFFAWFILRKLFEYFSSQPEVDECKLICVVEEAHRFLSRDLPDEARKMLVKVIREVRKWGMSCMLASQVLTDFSPEIRANCATKIQLRTGNERDLERIKSEYGSQYAKVLAKCKIGQGLFHFLNFNNGQPYFIQFRVPLSNVKSLTDDEIKKLKNN